ncbi:MAG: NAD(P)-binding protein [Pseudomonadales bacterium]|nr:NAD(P)-binding protein [Pseudomonadales bacterium]
MYEAALEPINVGGIEIPNRIVRAPHGTRLSGDALIAYHVARAKGGVGMSTVSATSVHPSAPGDIPLWRDECKVFLNKLADASHQHGMKMFHQIYHPGAGYAEAANAPIHWSASEIPNPMAGVVPVAISKAQIDDLVEHFAAAARRIRDAGMDGVDIHASSGYLIHEFLSPALNQREDDYGGNPENRMRLLIEVIDAVRSEVGDSGFAVGVRLPNDDYVPGGLTPDLVRDIAQIVDPLVDYVSLHMGAYWRFHKLIAPSDDPLGVEMSANNVIRSAITKPVMVTGRIMTMDHANHIVSSGEADMVSMVRALLADPELVNKARRGEEHRIRPCIGSNMGCVGRLMSGQSLSCVVNVAAAMETKHTHEPETPTATPKTILVVGGGPAGLEFARTAALRGHKVQLHEATKALGGQVNMASDAPHRGDIGAITHWLADELEYLQVDVRLNSLVDAESIQAAQPDAVVLATGTRPRSDGFQVSSPGAAIPGHDLAHVHNSWDLFGHGDPVDVTSPAVVFDDTGSFEAISVADVLLQAGASVTMISRFKDIGENVPFPPVTVGAARERLMDSDFDFIGGHYLREIGAREVDIGVLFTQRVRTIPAKTVILVTHNEPNRELAKALEGADIEVHQIGDIQGRNNIRNAIHSAALLGRAI